MAFALEVEGGAKATKAAAKKFGVALTAVKERFAGVTEALTTTPAPALERWFTGVAEGPGALLTFKTA